MIKGSSPRARLRSLPRKRRRRQVREPQKSSVGTHADVGASDACHKGAPFSRPGWLFEPKWDGYRAICFLHDGVLRFTSRNQRDLSRRFPELQIIAKSIKASSAIIDGEIVAIDEDGAQCFEQLQTIDAIALLSTLLLTSCSWTVRVSPVCH